MDIPRSKRRGPEREPSPTTPDPIEIAMEAEAGDTAFDSPARTLLINQNRLVRRQILNENASLALRILTGVAGLVAAGVVAAVLWNASQARGLVVEAFSVPPELAARGQTGPVVASDVLDTLAGFEKSANTWFVASVTDAWTERSHIEVANTGISLDDIDRLLRRFLGHQTYLTGEVVMTPAGVAMTARTGVGEAVRVEGPADQLHALSQQAAEQLYAQARPMNYVLMLRDRGDEAGARRITEGVLASSHDPLDRARAENQLGNFLTFVDGHPTEGLPHYRAAGRAAALPIRAMGLSNLGVAEQRLGHWQASLEALRSSAETMRRAGNTLPGNVAQRRFTVLYALRDFQGGRETLRPYLGVDLPGHAGPPGQYASYATALSGQHEISRARQFRGLPFQLAVDSEDWASVLVLRRDDDFLGTRPPYPVDTAMRVRALAGLGRGPEAVALASGMPADCYDCVIARGLAAEAAGDRPGADGFFLQATRLAPDAALAWCDWGRVELARGAPDRAAAHFKDANRRSPRWADPLAYWGEALLATGDAKGAIARFRQAAPFAPRWGRLHLMRGEALAAQGKAAEARAQFTAAAGMDLTPEERTRLATHLGGKS